MFAMNYFGYRSNIFQYPVNVNEKLIKFIGEEQYKELENILSTAADEKEKTKELLKKK